MLQAVRDAWTRAVVSGEGDVKQALDEAREAQAKAADAVAEVTDLRHATVSGLASKTYTGEPLTQEPVVKMGERTLVEGTDYVVSYASNVDAGEAKIVIAGAGSYTGSKTATFPIAKAENGVAAQVVATTQKATYNAAKATGLPANIEVDGADGEVTYVNVSSQVGAKKLTVDEATGAVTVPKGTPAGTYTVEVKVIAAGDGNHVAGSVTKSFTVTVAKAANPFIAKAKKATVKVKYSKVKGKAQVLASNVAVKKAKGKVRYKNVSAKAAAKKLKVNAKTGKVTVPKGTKKGTYRIKIKVTAPGWDSYKAGSKTVSYKVIVK